MNGKDSIDLQLLGEPPEIALQQEKVVPEGQSYWIADAEWIKSTERRRWGREVRSCMSFVFFSLEKVGERGGEESVGDVRLRETVGTGEGELRDW